MCLGLNWEALLIKPVKRITLGYSNRATTGWWRLFAKGEASWQQWGGSLYQKLDSNQSTKVWPIYCLDTLRYTGCTLQSMWIYVHILGTNSNTCQKTTEKHSWAICCIQHIFPVIKTTKKRNWWVGTNGDWRLLLDSFDSTGPTSYWRRLLRGVSFRHMFLFFLLCWMEECGIIPSP